MTKTSNGRSADVTRRQAMQGLTAATAVTALASGAVAQPVKPAAGPGASLHGASFYRFKLGDKQITILADGASLFPGAEVFAVNADPAQFKAVQARAFEPETSVNFHMNTVLVEEGNRRILVDAGAGHFFGEGFGRQALALKNAGIDAASIDTIVITHGHPDHFAGLLGPDLKPRFPNAKIVWDEREWAYWSTPGAIADLQRSKIPPAFVETFSKAIRAVLPATAARNEYVSGQTEIAPGVTFLPAPGHTPHSAVVLVTAGDKQLLVASDTTVLVQQNALHPEWITVFEMDAQQLVATRRRLLDRAAADKILWLGYHAPFPALGHIRATATAWEFVPVSWRW